MASRNPTPSRRTRWALWIAAAGATLFALAPITPAWQVRLLFAPLCHQRTERTLTLAGETMAVCSRCSGLYFGASLATILAAAMSGPRWWPRPVWFLAAMLPTLVDALLGIAGLPQLSLVPRHFLAWPAGFAAGWFFSLGVSAVCAAPGRIKFEPTVEVRDG
jgi:uncharacterized membrane protein